VAKNYNLEKYVRLSHQVVSARWDEATIQWQVGVKNMVTGEVVSDSADFLINGGGIIKWVAISYPSFSLFWYH
jgi:cation diffusion facilitator CzcD-associated flavoprotein CzcO